MRPLSLDVTGLRSHSGTTSIVFPEDWQLTAIVGPTGAGKSSLLEAIVYALFGSGTVPNASQPINLIADNVGEMRVVLGFEVGGIKHDIVRTYRRGGATPPPVLRSPGETVSGVTQVGAAIFRLLRLSPDAFCQTALLPQGRFARLLEAGTSQQRDTLNEFFQLGEVTEVTDRLVTASDRVTAARARVTIVRAQLPADPRADLLAAEGSLHDAWAVALMAASLAREVAQLQADAKEAEGRAALYQEATTSLLSTAGSLLGVAEEAARLASLAAEIDGQESEAMKVAEDARGALIGAKSRLDRLEPLVVSTAKAAVEVLRTRANEAAEAATHAAQSDEQAYGAEEQYQLAEAELQKANSAYVDLEQSAQGAEGVATSTAGRVQMGDALLETSQRTAQAKSEADGRVGDAGRDLESAEEATKTAAIAEGEAERAVGAGREAAENANGRLGSVIEDAAKAVEEAGRLAMLAQTFSETESAEQIAKAAFETAETEAANAGTQRDGAVKAREAATSSFQQAEQVLEEARVAGAAAACATHAYPGEPCPVCKRALPRDFEPPTAPPELTKAEEETARARAARDAAVETAASAQGRFDAAEKALSLAQEASTNATGERANKEAAYELAGGDDQLLRTQGLAEAAEGERRAAEAAAREADTAVAKAEGLWKARKEALRPLEEARARAQRAFTDAAATLAKAESLAAEAAAAYTELGGDEALQKARTESEKAAATAQTERAAADKAKERVDKLNAQREEARLLAGKARTSAMAASEHAVRALAAESLAAKGIPEMARMRAGEDPTEILAVAEEWTRSRGLQVEETEAVVDGAHTLVEKSEAQVALIGQRRSTEHDGPLSRLTTKAAGLGAVIDADTPPTGDAIGLREWAGRSAATAKDLAVEKENAASAARQEAAASTERATTRCEEAVTTVEELGSWRASKDAAVGESRMRYEQAETAEARCAELDSAMDATAERAGLLEAAKALSRGRGNFVNYVLTTRRRQLLLEAAAVLGELSGQRLVFDTDATDRFSVVDTVTAAVRDPRLLSGGEQFQASLALALALVEIAARGGSRIECLLLDEGFAALDSRSLDVALDALEMAARRGRRIITVTHIQEVSSRCDRVLEVRNDVSGSKTTWSLPS